MPAVDAQSIQQRVEFRATHRRAVDVDGDHARVPRREHCAHAGAGAEVEDVGTRAQLEIGNDRGEERAGSQQPRIEHRRQHQQRRALHVLETQLLTMRARDAVTEAEDTAKPGAQQPLFALAQQARGQHL